MVWRELIILILNGQKAKRPKTFILREKMKEKFRNIIEKLSGRPKEKDIINNEEFQKANEKYLKILQKIREISFYIYTIAFIIFFISYFLNILIGLELLSFSLFISFFSVNFAIYFDIKYLNLKHLKQGEKK
jgi:hypothetical protein